MNTDPGTGATGRAVDKGIGAPPPHPLMGRTFLVRVLSALVLAPLAVLAVYLGGWIFCALIILAGLLMLWEWQGITERKSSGLLLAVAAATLILCAVLVKQSYPVAAVSAAGAGLLVVGVTACLLRRRVIWPVLGLLYVLVPCLSVLWIRAFPEIGFAICIWMFTIVWATDIGGYIVGASVGGPKLMPRISPKKTWSGLLGGIVMAGTVSAVIGLWFDFAITAKGLFVIAGGLAVVAQAGDLVESALKRHFGVKDSGHLIPGHGGIMDRVDGLVPVLPVVAAGLWFLQGLDGV